VFLPIVLQVSDVIKNQVIPEVQKLVDKFKALSPETIETGVKVAGLIAILGPLVFVIGKVIGAVTGFITVFKILSIALLTNPIYLVIAGITVLVVALIHAFKTSDKFRQGIQKLGNAFIVFAEGAINFVINHMNLFLQGMNFVIRGLQMFGLNVKEVGQIAPVSLKRISLATVEATEDVSDLSKEANNLGTAVSTNVVPPVTKMNKGLEKTSEELKKVKEAAKNAAQVVVDNLENALRKAESALEDVRGKFNNFKNAIGNTISGILNFGKAAESQNFLEGLTKQVSEATLFADKVRKLIVAGLSERAIRLVLDSGFEAGSKIADEIIAGGSTVVDQVNSLVAAVDSVAEQVGEFGAVTFYDAGVKQAEAMVAGIKAALENARAELKSIVDSLATGTAETTTTGPSAPTPTPKPKPKPKPLFTGTNLNVPAGGVMGFGPKPKPFDFGFRANGGPVTGGSPFIVGERGPELFIPNTSGSITPNNQMSNGNSTINITVNAGIGTDGNAVGRQIVDAIKRFEKTSGPVFASA
jgi:hypothetical protein